MKWVIGGALLLFLLFNLAVHVSTAIHDPATGQKLPKQGRWKRILLAVIHGFPFV